jgi:hypothetical protein
MAALFGIGKLRNLSVCGIEEGGRGRAPRRHP